MTAPLKVRFWGVRGSIPVPGAAAAGFGGNTSCVQISTGNDTEVILDAGTGIRELGAALAGRCRVIHILLTHLHLDHIQGLMFFAPLFDPSVEVTIWGPPSGQQPLRERLARYISTPLSPIEIRELPAHVKFEDVVGGPWELDGFEVRAALVAHRGPTLGYRLSSNGTSLCYLPDHEPGLGVDLNAMDPAWISGYGLARNASLLIHDCQYDEDEYRRRRGWGHSSVSDAVTFARRSECRRVLMFHHDPAHDDGRLEAIGAWASERWEAMGTGGSLELAREGQVIEVAA
jgi:phosphoribosyl 1,2-cyclic phosphodiesterase